MVPPPADFLAKLLPQELIDCAHTITIRWDQWVKCVITCEHENFTAVSDFFHMTEALLRAAERFRNGEHPGYCGKDYADTTPDADGVVEPVTLDCTLWTGRAGECGGD